MKTGVYKYYEYTKGEIPAVDLEIDLNMNFIHDTWYIVEIYGKEKYTDGIQWYLPRPAKDPGSPELWLWVTPLSDLVSSRPKGDNYYMEPGVLKEIFFEPLEISEGGEKQASG